jgi:DUF4097 and DUF4098 domain-containing protein YvlB
MATHRFPLTGAINLNVRVAHGSVHVTTQDELREASVSLEPGAQVDDDKFTVEMRGPTLHVLGPQGGLFDRGWFARRDRSGVDVRITVPTGTAVKIATFTAPVTIDGRVGGADLAFGTGDADLREVDGDLRLRFGRGTVRAQIVRGSVHARSGSGNLRLGAVHGDLHAGCGNGDLYADDVRGRTSSRCGSGTAHLGAVHGDVDLASGSGRVEIGLPAGVSAYLDLHTGSGGVRSDLPVEGNAITANESITIRARTGSGDVRLFRAADTDEVAVAVD